MKDGALDAFFFVGGAPAGAIAELASSGAGIELLPITGAQADTLRRGNPFFANDSVPAATYKDVAAVNTLSVGAQWVTSAKADTETVYQITKSLYSDATQKALAAGHAKGKLITVKNAVQGAGIPFHPGAERFYKEAGVLK
jgi:TRAP transporter TAXI family solute receptor